MSPSQEASRPNATILYYTQQVCHCAFLRTSMGHCTVAGVAGVYYLGGGPQCVLSGVATFAFRQGRAAS